MALYGGPGEVRLDLFSVSPALLNPRCWPNDRLRVGRLTFDGLRRLTGTPEPMESELFEESMLSPHTGSTVRILSAEISKR